MPPLRSVVAVVCAALSLTVPLAACGDGQSSTTAPPTVNASTRTRPETMAVMALGDSLTAGDEYYRPLLVDALARDRCRVDFVGSQIDPSGTDPEHEGHAGLRADELAENLAGWATANRPDVALVYAGTNDVLQGESAALVVRDIETLVSRLRGANPRVAVLIGLLTPPDGRDDVVAELNVGLGEIADQLDRSISPVVTVDLNEGFDAALHLTEDGVHPSPTGAEHIAQRWFDGYQGLLGNRSCDPL